jgi:hypothetical protein
MEPKTTADTWPEIKAPAPVTEEPAGLDVAAIIAERDAFFAALETAPEVPFL